MARYSPETLLFPMFNNVNKKMVFFKKTIVPGATFALWWIVSLEKGTQPMLFMVFTIVI